MPKPDNIIPEMVTPTSVCLHPELWHAYDNMSTEIEVIDLLRALVIALKPTVIVETGCWRGHGTIALAIGALTNGFGGVWTCDLSYESIAATRDRLHTDQPPHYPVVLQQCSGVDLINSLNSPVDFAFLDSGPDEIRCHELRAIYPKLSLGGVVALHDTGPHGFLREKYLPPLLRELDMQYIFFDTPRGMALCRKQPEIYP